MMKWLCKITRLATKTRSDEMTVEAENRALYVQLHEAEDLAKRMEQEALFQRKRADVSRTAMDAMTTHMVN